MRNASDLVASIEKMHRTKAVLQETVIVKEVFNEQVVWEGEVSIFELEGHLEAAICYAWSSPIDGSDKRKFYAVLKIPPVETPLDAVRASIVSDSKK